MNVEKPFVLVSRKRGESIFTPHLTRTDVLSLVAYFYNIRDMYPDETFYIVLG